MPLTILEQRACGDCNACCIVFDIDEPTLKKKRRVACTHLGQGGCTTYNTRPPTCRAFECLWLKGVGDPVDDRPDRCGFVMHAVSPPDNEIMGDIVILTELHGGELAPGTHGREVADEVAKQARTIMMTADGGKHLRVPMAVLTREEHAALKSMHEAMASRRGEA